MNINKRLDRMKQWAGERMGQEIKTGQSDEFKMMEAEMQLRHEGMERMHKTMTTYVKSLSKVKEAEDKEKALPVALMGTVMVAHGDDFEPESEFGQCLITFGRANERISRMQENYVGNATTSWLESTERSLAQMKEYQNARKKLESRRLAFDTSQIKLQKSKREDFRMEEELRAQRAKYEESQDDVERRMMDIKEAETDSIADLTAFLEAEFAYYDRAREVLMQLRKDWPASQSNGGASIPINSQRGARPVRSRSNTTSSFRGGNAITEDPAEDYAASPSSYTAANDLRPPLSFSSRSRAGSNQNSPRRELPGFDLPVRPNLRSTNSTFEGGASYQNSRDASPAPSAGGSLRLARVPTDGSMGGLRSNLRPVKRNDSDVFGDQDLDGEDDRSVSPSNSYDGRGGQQSRSASWSVQQQQQQDRGYSNGRGNGNNNQRGYDNDSQRGYDNGGSQRGYDNGGSQRGYDNGGSQRGYDNGGSQRGYDNNSSQRGYDNGSSQRGYDNNGGGRFDDDIGKKKMAPPPPPPSRAKKPPPPPPIKRSALSSSEVPQY